MNTKVRRRFTDNPAVTVVEAVAEANDVDPLESDVRLYDVIDPDALNRLFGPRRTTVGSPSVDVTFSMAGCDVSVSSDGMVVAKVAETGSVPERTESDGVELVESDSVVSR
ncbi:HalOD1 output domain-containing protein [Halomontanus rarus]|uniref:HalOD1 output domain-containing protein n=1 Tax=Halomontanus rarus TaxID=3034020 RepID=UPI0023E8C37E|nr:HalOD1 output domain-containing protein [Halovivax sp. TS33]